MAAPTTAPTVSLRLKSARRQELEQCVHEATLGAGRAPLHDARMRALEHKFSADRAELPSPLHPGRYARRPERDRPFEKVHPRRREHEERRAVELWKGRPLFEGARQVLPHQQVLVLVD